MLLRSMGRFSCGIQIGFRYGFDSGNMLDYVYENTPRGLFLVGRLIDRAYLNGPGWTGIRLRKIHLKHILKEIIEANKKNHKETVVMDLAGGPGRYLLETIQENPNSSLTVICRDMSEEALSRGRELAGKLGIQRIIYERADAFNPKDLKRASPKPNVIVVSGLYELFTDNNIIRKSMRDISDVLSLGDYFVFTNQPYHPQLELIARILPNRIGEPWVMKLRSDEEVKGWASEAGFQTIKTLVDHEGIFSVNLAQKIR